MGVAYDFAAALAGLFRLQALWCALLLACSENAPKSVEADAGPPPPVALLASVKGSVELIRDGVTTQAALGPLWSGDILQTGAASRAILRLGSQEIELSENTRFAVGDSLRALDVMVGEIVLLGDDAQGATFETPFGRTALAAGGRALLSKLDGGYELSVAVGRLELMDEDGGLTATAGTRIRFGVGELRIEDVVPEAPEAMPVVTARAEQGRPLLKLPGASRFSPATKSAELPEGVTAFQVPGKARLRLESEAIGVEIAAGMSGTVSGAERNSGSGGAVLKVALKGKASSRLRFDGPSALQLSGTKGLLTLSATAESDAQLSLGAGGPRVEVVTGRLEFASPQGQVTVANAGEVLLPNSEGGVEVKARPRPPLLLPANKNVRVYATKLPEVGLRLPAGKKVHVRLAADAAFKDLLASGQAQEALVTRVPPSGQLFWSIEEQGQPVTNGSAHFASESRQHAAGPRADVVAETGLKATVLFQSSVPSLTFVLPENKAARAFLFRVFRVGALDVPIVERKVSGTSVLVESGLLTEGSYVWFASPLDDGGKEIAGGRMNRMDIVFDNSLTSLRITSPQEGSAAGRGVVAAGIAPRGSKLSVNGKRVSLEASGRFSVPVGAVDTVIFELSRPDGTQGFWVRRLRK